MSNQPQVLFGILFFVTTILAGVGSGLLRHYGRFTPLGFIVIIFILILVKGVGLP